MTSHKTVTTNGPSNRISAFVPTVIVLHKRNVYAGHETPDLERQHSAVVVVESKQMKRTPNMYVNT